MATCSPANPARRFAAIDIGTVTSRMLVADVDDAGNLTEVKRSYTITNLGENVDKTHELDDMAIERTAQAIAQFKLEIDVLTPCGGPDIPVTAIATSASRDAKNADRFVSRLAEIGISLSVIPGEREAALSFLGASSAFPGEAIAVVDVGGGSTEIICGQAGCNPMKAHSFNIGCRRVTERFLHTDPPTADEIAQARAWIDEGFGTYFEELRANDFTPARMVAVAGTATSVVSMREKMEKYDSSRVHGAEVTREDLDSICAALAALPLEQRKKVTGLDPDRAPVIVAGLIVLQQIMEKGGFASFTVSERDILHGIILDAASA